MRPDCRTAGCHHDSGNDYLHVSGIPNTRPIIIICGGLIRLNVAIPGQQVCGVNGLAPGNNRNRLLYHCPAMAHSVSPWLTTCRPNKTIGTGLAETVATGGSTG